MQIFPTDRKEFKLNSSQADTLERLHRRTEKSDALTSRLTDCSFVGTVRENEFTLISSEIGRGAFCVMTGVINSDSGHVRVEIHKVFKILTGIIMCLPVIVVLVSAISGRPEILLSLIIVGPVQVLFIRYGFIGIAFRLLSKASLSRLRDVLDVEWLPTK
jgi:hypothetical protein